MDLLGSGRYCLVAFAMSSSLCKYPEVSRVKSREKEGRGGGPTRRLCELADNEEGRGQKSGGLRLGVKFTEGS